MIALVATAEIETVRAVKLDSEAPDVQNSIAVAIAIAIARQSQLTRLTKSRVAETPIDQLSSSQSTALAAAIVIAVVKAAMAAIANVAKKQAER